MSIESFIDKEFIVLKDTEFLFTLVIELSFFFDFGIVFGNDKKIK